ncbi:MAG: TetR/AcrR family transcriptional regulator [Actinomycetota bacterium]|jgi:AcrR family transcriptional regulator|nr:TetR/AcrR family transcriptional regulator [Actinomycetota bacterium]
MQLRWGEEVPSDAEAARARLVNAAEECFRRYGVAKTTVDDVAAAAKVSRATVYRYFGDRDKLVLGVVLRDARRFLNRLGTAIERQDTFERAVVQGVLSTVDAARADESLGLLFAPDTIGITTSIVGASEALFDLASDFMRPLLRDAQRQGLMRTDVQLDEAAEWILRTIISLLTVEGPRRRSPAQQRRFVSTFLVSALVPAASSDASVSLQSDRAPRSRPARRPRSARSTNA